MVIWERDKDVEQTTKCCVVLVHFAITEHIISEVFQSAPRKIREYFKSVSRTFVCDYFLLICILVEKVNNGNVSLHN